MGKIGLIDVDGHHFPNLALMRISAFHKSIGDTVEWCRDGIERFDKVYVSKVFSDTYSKDIDFTPNAKEVIRGGTGYQIHLSGERERYNTASDHVLPQEIESAFPDYSLYPQYDFAVSMTSRGCPRGCPFCHVKSKEGLNCRKVANVSDFYSGQKLIEVCDPNITACPDKRDLFQQYIDTKALINFNQGLDIRLLNDADINDINHMRIKNLHFAWDNPKEDLEPKFRYFKENFRRRSNIGMVYCLTNYNSSMEENLHRIYTLRDLGYDPYVMIYDKNNAPLEVRKLQRWCNNKIIFKTVKDFNEYTREKG